MMTEPEIRDALDAMDMKSGADAAGAWERLRPLGPAVLPYFAEAFPKFKRAEGRAAVLYYCTRWARSHPAAFRLGLQALSDRSRVVRYRACGVVAYSLRAEALPALIPLLTHPDPRTVEDAHAARAAIASRNHHLYIDRGHTGRIFWQVNESDRPF